MHTAAQTLRDINIVAYTALGAVALLLWHRRRDRAARWAAAAFALLAAVELLSLLPNHRGSGVEAAFARLEILLLVLFPYVLFRFTGAFRRPARRLANGLVVLTAVLAVWTFALPSVPRSGEHWPPVFAAFVALFAVHWVTLSVVSAVRLWRAGTGLPTVSRRRIRFMAGGASALALALILAASSSHAGPRHRARLAGARDDQRRRRSSSGSPRRGSFAWPGAAPSRSASSRRCSSC